MLRILALCAGLIAVGCGGGGGGDAPPVSAAPPPCPSASTWSGTACAPFARRETLRAPTPFVEDGSPVSLEVVLFTPLAPAPHPLLVFHHGSTGNGDDPSLFRITFVSETVAKAFADRGWAVAFPQRRGRGASDGLYDEGFEPDRSRYSCLQGPAFAGLERALADADAALDFLRNRPGIDTSRILAGGHSRGGLLAVAQSGQRVDVLRGAINFVGGWLGEGCQDAVLVNRSSFVRGSASPHPSLWLYAKNDPFYSIAHSQANFDAHRAAGGQATLRIHERAAGLSGHFLLNDPALWAGDLDRFLD